MNLVTLGTDIENKWRDWQDLPVLDAQQLSRSSNHDPKFAQELLDAFFSSAINHLAEIENAVQDQNLSAISHIGYAAKGSSQSIGATRLAALCLSLEQDEDLVSAELITPLLKDEVGKVRERAIELGLWRTAA
jgi:HPt (histidine-containing phosphotransfer) domain-containing protein